MMLVPVVSWHSDDNGSVAQMIGLGASGTDHCDNVLLEWELALALFDSPHHPMKAICPVLLGGTDSRGFLPFPFFNLAHLADIPSLATKTRLVELCEKYGVPLSESAIRRSVKGTVEALLQNQGIKLEDLGKEVIATTSCINRIFDTGATILLSIGLEQPLLGESKPQKLPRKSVVSATLIFPPGVGPSYAHNVAYMFCGDKYCKWDLQEDKLKTGPRSIKDGWTGFPFDRLDATLVYTSSGPEYTQNAAYFFCGDSYCKWNLSDDSLMEGSKSLSLWSGYPYDRVDATLVFPEGVGPGYAKNAAYFFCGDTYCKWDLVSDTLWAGPRNIKDGWPGIPFDFIDAAVIYPQGVGPDYTKNVAYIFCGDMYCKWDLETDSLKAGARSINDGWQGYSFV